MRRSSPQFPDDIVNIARAGDQTSKALGLRMVGIGKETFGVNEKTSCHWKA
jgi:hypothetical protein